MTWPDAALIPFVFVPLIIISGRMITPLRRNTEASNNEALRMLSSVSYGGADVGEILDVVSRVTDGDRP